MAAGEFITLYKHKFLPDFLARYERNQLVGGVAINLRRMTPPQGKIWGHRHSNNNGNNNNSAPFSTIIKDRDFFTGIPTKYVKTISYVNRTVGF